MKTSNKKHRITINKEKAYDLVAKGIISLSDIEETKIHQKRLNE